MSNVAKHTQKAQFLVFWGFSEEIVLNRKTKSTCIFRRRKTFHFWWSEPAVELFNWRLFRLFYLQEHLQEPNQVKLLTEIKHWITITTITFFYVLTVLLEKKKKNLNQRGWCVITTLDFWFSEKQSTADADKISLFNLNLIAKKWHTRWPFWLNVVALCCRSVYYFAWPVPKPGRQLVLLQQRSQHNHASKYKEPRWAF